MTDRPAVETSLPEPRPPERDDPVQPAALVLPAVAEPPLNERRPWLERDATEIDDALAVPGTDTPLYLTADRIGITTTGIGKSDAATTVTALATSPGVDLESSYVLSAGLAGGPPERVALGSVVVADAVVDWDRKHRWDRERDRSDDGDGSAPDIDPLAYRPRDYVHRLSEALVERALETASDVDLLENDAVFAYQNRYPNAPDAGPTVDRGTTVCGDEFWHGPQYAREVDWLCEQYGVGPYVTTQMEDAATATALERFGLREQYLSVRAVGNYDRPAPGQSVEESFDGNEASLALAIDNAARVGSAIVADLVTADPLGLEPPRER